MPNAQILVNADGYFVGVVIETDPLTPWEQAILDEGGHFGPLIYPCPDCGGWDIPTNGSCRCR